MSGYTCLLKLTKALYMNKYFSVLLPADHSIYKRLGKCFIYNTKLRLTRYFQYVHYTQRKF